MFNVLVYNCHGSWTENSTVFIIARHVGSQHGVCISYRPLEGNSVRLVVGDGCHRGILPPPDHHLAANLTVRGKFNLMLIYLSDNMKEINYPTQHVYLTYIQLEEHALILF